MTKAAKERPTRSLFCLRFPDDLREQLAVEAEASERSLAKEIVHRLRNSLKQQAPDQVTA